MKLWFKIFFYISIIFLIITLIKEDYFIIPIVYNHKELLLSFSFLFLAFLFNTLAWTSVLRQANIHIPVSHGISSIGLSIFGKYIPGKVWIVLGRAEYISYKHNHPLREITSLSVNNQLISLWTGLLLGTIGLILINAFSVYSLGIIFVLLLLSLAIFTKFFHHVTELIINSIFKKQIRFPKLSLFKTLAVIPWFFLNWLCWCIAFYFLSASLMSEPVNIFAGLAFSLGGSLGILAVAMPGGLGVREGILVGYLSLTNIAPKMATTIAITSRLWFLVGEGFIFFLGLMLDKKKVRDKNPDKLDV